MPRGEDTSKHPNRQVGRPTPRIAEALIRKTNMDVNALWAQENPRPSWTPTPATLETAQGYIDLYRLERDYYPTANSNISYMGGRIRDAIRSRGQ